MASKCHHCGKNVSPKKNKCTHCGKPPFHCRRCGELITNKKLCYGCGFFICEHCGSCGNEEFNCTAIIGSQDFKGNKEQYIKIARHVLKLRNNPPRRECERGVPVSQAFSKIKYMELKMKGCYCKSEDDRKKFNKRFTDLAEKPIGYIFTITKARPDGCMGYEERTIANRLLCEGLYKKNRKFLKKEIKKGKRKGEFNLIPYDEYERIEKKPCENISRDLVYKICERCNDNTKYSVDIDFCDKHDEPIKLKRIINDFEFCQLPTKSFKIKKEKDGE